MHGIEESDSVMVVMKYANMRGCDTHGGVDGAKGRGQRKGRAAKHSRSTESDTGCHMRRSLTQSVCAVCFGGKAG